MYNYDNFYLIQQKMNFNFLVSDFFLNVYWICAVELSLCANLLSFHIEFTP